MQRMYLTWIDVNGYTRLTLVNTTTGASTILTYMLAKSNADWINLNETGFTVNGSPNPIAGTFENVGDAAALSFVDGSGLLTTLQLPAPKDTIFMTDTVTVDSSQIPGLIAACVGVLTTQAGVAVVSFAGGIRRATTKELYQ